MTRQDDTINHIFGFLFWALRFVFYRIPRWYSFVLLFWLKKPINQIFDLQQFSRTWKHCGLFYRFIQFLACVHVVAALFYISNYGRFADREPAYLLVALLHFASSLLSAMIVQVVEWLYQYSQDPEMQKQFAGQEAENYVKRCLEIKKHALEKCETLHGQLFVFNSEQENEFSVEVDHLLITQNNVYVIETKYKSATIHAHATAASWKVVNMQGEGTMRNALLQAKNAARVLKKALNLNTPPIPLVAIYGDGTAIVDGPANVVVACDIQKIIDAFELGAPTTPAIDPHSLKVLLETHIDNRPAARDRHIARANLAQVRHAAHELVKASSL